MNDIRRRVQGQSVSVIGAARSGLAAARLLERQGARVFVTDSAAVGQSVLATLKEERIDYETGGHSRRALQADFVVVSPGVPDSTPIVQEVLAARIPLYSEIEVASWFCRAPIAAVTGSNGKTTTTSLLEHVLNHAGRPVIAAGNIGNPFSDYADTVSPDTVVVLEVSSFQLDHIASFRPHIAMLLNITPDHLDRYDQDFAKYARSKFRIAENLRSGDAFIYNADDPAVAPHAESVVKPGVVALPFSRKHSVTRGVCLRDQSIVFRENEEEEEPLMPMEELALRGPHNLYNSLAASMAARFLEVSNDSLRESMRTFEGVPHRLELVGEVRGVRFVNDSKATNVNAVWYALESFDENIVLIAGGIDKGNDYGEIRDLVASRVRGLVTLGRSAEKIESELGPLVEQTRRASSMEEAVRLSIEIASAGEIVLLSPACASFDMFDNYEQRGDVFRKAVQALQ